MTTSLSAKQLTVEESQVTWLVTVDSKQHTLYFRKEDGKWSWSVQPGASNPFIDAVATAITRELNQ